MEFPRKCSTEWAPSTAYAHQPILFALELFEPFALESLWANLFLDIAFWLDAVVAGQRTPSEPFFPGLPAVTVGDGRLDVPRLRCPGCAVVAAFGIRLKRDPYMRTRARKA